ncbi:cytochrome c biogenesis protein CcsA [Aurantibacter sp.]|uniref:cytochrome c biogenesis protein CcsA n=1 Tax=Aurantibacter sp. TaxID=2807103 RepID=UPI0035C7DD75
MQNKLAKILFSTRLMSVLFIVFAVAMAAGTILDRNMDTSPTPYTRNIIYNAWWFEAIMVFFIINFCGNIVRFRLYKKEKWATLTLHLAFILILVGAFITRYYSFEGMMPIREGETENTFLSQKTYITGYVNGDYKINGVAQRLPVNKEVDFSGRMENNFSHNGVYGDQPFSIELEKFVLGAEKDIVASETGEAYLKMVEAGNSSPHNHYLKDGGKAQNIHNTLIALNNYQAGAINISSKNGQLFIESPFEGEYLQMATMNKGKLYKDSIQPLMLRSRYVIGEMQMVFPKPVTKGEFDIVQKSKLLKNDEDGVVLKITTKNETKRLLLLGGLGVNNQFERVEVGGLEFDFRYGSKVLNLPFSIKLNDFVAERYPGSATAYASFMSKVTVIDEEKGDFDYKVFMNNILDHRGYRFFQAKFDENETRTILSVNHDFYGTWVTYIGYFLLYFGMMAILFDKNTRFADLKRYLEKTKEKKSKLLSVLLIAFTLGTNAQEQHSEHDGHNHATQQVQENSVEQEEQHSENDGHEHTKRQERKAPTKAQIDSVLIANVAPKDIADHFGKLVIQDVGGRMMPVDTYASELLRKISKSDTYVDLSANQVFLSIQESPMLWYNVPVIYIKPKKGDSLRSILGLPKTQKYATLLDFFSDDFRYKLDPYLEEATSAQVKSGIQKEFVEANERVSLLSSAIEGRSLKIYPIPNDDNNKWISAFEYKNEDYKTQVNDTIYGNYIQSSFDYYLYNLNNDKQTKDFTKSKKLLSEFTKLQNKLGAEVMIPEDKVNAEISYNKFDVFKKLFSWYMYAGTLLFILLIVQIFKDKSKRLSLAVNVFKIVIIGLFILHTLGLIVRWYISGHAPWSDAYESMIYVAWATMFFTLTIGVTKNKSEAKELSFTGKIKSFFNVSTSDLTLAAGTFVTAMILMIAHWNWMDPAIANLQPVLNSYWLMIHVAVIVASYGPFTLGAILGIVSLLLMIFTTEKTKTKMDLNIKELTTITEMALTVGLVMLTIGNFLGGQWANESWGRYWGWDPKETWALISIMVYAFVIHMRLVPGLRGRWFFNLMSIIAFASILMTYFGVNFYLSGLHSYASGDQIVSLKFIGIAIGLIAILGFFSYRKYSKYYKK